MKPSEIIYEKIKPLDPTDAGVDSHLIKAIISYLDETALAKTSGKSGGNEEETAETSKESIRETASKEECEHNYAKVTAGAFYCDKCGCLLFASQKELEGCCKEYRPATLKNIGGEACGNCFGSKEAHSQSKEEQTIRRKCDCAERSCEKDCSKNHTHKVFTCEECDPHSQSKEECNCGAGEKAHHKENCPKAWSKVYQSKEEIVNHKECPAHCPDCGKCLFLKPYHCPCIYGK